MSPCAGIKADGGRCGAQAITGNQWCVGHDPDKAEARRRRASKGGKRGGRGRPMVEVHAVKDKLQDLADRVLDGSLDRADAAVVSQIYNVLLRAVGVEMKVREVEELARELEEVREILETQKGGRRWG